MDMAKHSVVGKRVSRIDAIEMVTGKAKYNADVTLPGTLCGKVLRSPHAHARIKRMDTSKAEMLPGVKAVVTAEDVPVGTVFATDKVYHIGQQVAAVAAEDSEAAEEALELIEVDYEPLPAVVDLLEAMKPDAPIVREDAEEFFDENGVKLNNIAVPPYLSACIFHA